jgi:hypothetical protein
MRTAQAVERGLCIGLLVGVTFGFVAGVGLVVKKPDRFGLVHVGSGALPGTYTSGGSNSANGKVPNADAGSGEPKTGIGRNPTTGGNESK